MMIAVAVAAVLTQVIRGEGSLAAGAVIVGTCVLTLAVKLAGAAIARERAGGRPVGSLRKSRIGLTSLVSAIAIIGLADLAFLVVYEEIAGMINQHHYHRKISLEGCFIGASSVLLATFLLRHALRRWLTYRPKFGIQRLMIAVAIVAVLLAVLRSEGHPILGAAIVAASVLILACRLSIDAIGRKPPGRWKKFRAGITSFLLAVSLIASADFAFLWVAILVGQPWREPRQLGVGGLFAGVVAALLVSVCLRKAIRSMREGSAGPRSPGGPTSPTPVPPRMLGSSGDSGRSTIGDQGGACQPTS